ncbi:MAG: hypothetical protein KJ915_02305 [Candidatus Omnitrophica bacterium]|nr:hypothetical protein [Candidatus Omnitrophota bacterium]
MRLRISLVLLSLVLFVNSAFCAQRKEITLQDNTVIYGEVVGLENGIYKIKTNDMGLLTISEEKVVSIRNQTQGNNIVNQDANDLQFAPQNPADPRAVEAGVEALKRKMSSDPATMQTITALQNDPELIAVLNDPEIMSAITSGDIEALNSNPKFIKLMNNSKIKGIGSKVD